MSRRDTIIIAVLLNAGLLIVLFATSLKSDKAEDEPSAITVLASNQSEVALPPQSITPVVAPATHDPVDRVIEQYVTPQVASSEQQNSNFLADLQAIGTPAAASSETPVDAPQQAAAPETSYKEVKVKKGDVLERIARQNHVSVSEIMKVNKLTSTRLKIGQVLKIPANTTSKTASAATVAGAQYYTIKPGDNPWTIAVKHHMKVEDLLKLNNMDEQKAKRLKAGDKIRIN
jgi:peptidoglycan DL-endopeptidase LytF